MLACSVARGDSSCAQARKRNQLLGTVTLGRHRELDAARQKVAALQAPSQGLLPADLDLGELALLLDQLENALAAPAETFFELEDVAPHVFAVLVRVA